MNIKDYKKAIYNIRTIIYVKYAYKHIMILCLINTILAK